MLSKAPIRMQQQKQVLFVKLLIEDAPALHESGGGGQREQVSGKEAVTTVQILFVSENPFSASEDTNISCHDIILQDGDEGGWRRMCVWGEGDDQSTWCQVLVTCQGNRSEQTSQMFV